VRRRDPEAMRLSPVPRHGAGELFLKGPIPWAWLHRAICLPGRALHVALQLWFHAGIAGNGIVAINLSRLSVDRSAASRGLAALEAAGLVRVQRKPGRKPLVTILPALGIRQ
jgi:DNA-binding transcriptional ArsR family regulator